MIPPISVVDRVVPNAIFAPLAFRFLRRCLTRAFPVHAAAALLLAAPFARATPTISFSPAAFPATGSPVALATTPAGLNISVNAAPTATYTISQVAVSVNGAVIGSATGSSPFVVNWVPTATGTYTISATVTDTSPTTTGASASNPTATINNIVTITTARAATLLSPAANATVPLNSQIFLRSTATLSDGVVSKVDFILDPTTSNTLIGTATQSPYNIAYTVTASVGAHTVIARATPSAGATVDSATTNFTVSTPVGTGPTVALTAPAANSTVGLGAAITLTATASDADGFIPTTTGGGVTFYVDGDPVGTDLTAPYSVSWTPSVAKIYSLRAQTTDDKGNTTLSASPYNVTAVTALPTVTVSAASAANVGTAITLSATAAASPGATVTQVEFLENGVVIGTDTTSPYSISWTPSTIGTSAITARVTDSAALVVTSSAVNVTVSAAVPTVALTAPATVTVNTVTTLTATATPGTGAAITQVQFLSGTTVLGTDTTAPYSFDWTPTATGVVSLTAKVTDSNGATTSSTAVSVTVAAPAAPTVSITAPVTGAIVGVGGNVTVTAAATPGAGATVAQVQFLVGTTIIGTVSAAPYTVIWVPTSAGNFSLTARVLDSNNASVTSSAVTVTTVNATAVSLTAPAAGATAPAGNTVNLTATASASPGATITQVAFFADGVAIGSPVTSAPYTVAWTPSTAGTVLLTARATDSQGTIATSSAVSFTVSDAASLTVSLGVSPGSTTLPAGATRYALATVTPATGRAIVRVEFLVNGASVAVKTIAPYAYKFTAPATPGAYTLIARATDNAGATRDAQLTLSVVSAVGAAPTVSLLAPANNTTVVPNSAFTLAATASAPGGTIASVQFFQNGVAIGAPATASPFIGSFTPTAAGSYSLEAIATDDRGNTAVSSAVMINAVFGTPTVTLTAPRNGARLTPAVPVTLNAIAVGGNGSPVTLVEFLLDGAQLGIRTSPTAAGGIYTFAWTPDVSQLGAHLLSARVTDANSSTVTSTAINVTVAAIVGVPPTISIFAPIGAAATSIQSLSTVNFVANNVLAFGTQSGGQPNTIANVEFFLNDVSIGLAARQGTANTYRLTFNFPAFDLSAITPDANGRYPVTLYAIARDTNGNQTPTATSTLLIAPSTSLPPTFGTAGIISTNTTAIAGTTIQLFAPTAVDPDGTLVSVQYFANGANIATSQTGPIYAVNFTPNAAGTYNVYGVATDDTGNTAVSGSVTINVTGNSAPVVALVRPVDNAAVTNVGAPIFLEATASDVDAGQTITVVFLNGTTPLATGQRVGTTTTYRAVWIPTGANTYTVTARATDSAGAQTTSAASRTVVVNNLVGFAPVITLNIPGSVTTNSTASFTATATDSDGIVTAVEFFVNRTSIGQAVRDQTSNIWRLTTSFGTLPIGNVEVVAIATDNSGNLTATPTANLNIAASTSAAPTINIATDKTTVAFSQPAQLSANAFDAGGTITSVQYFANGVSVGTSTTAPTYLVSWTASASGTYNVYALATDNTGNTAVANSLTVTVKRNNPILDDDAFILQTFQDLLVRNPNPIELANYSGMIAAGTSTRAQLVATLAADPGFNNTVNLCAAYYLLMNEWPTYTNYQTLFASRGNLGAVVGQILGSSEYIFKYGSTTAATLNASYANAYTPFATRLWQTAFGRSPNVTELFQFQNNDTALPNLGRGYTVVGLNTAIAEFITRTYPGNTAFQNLARSAALYYQLLKAQPAAAQIATLAALPDPTAIATAVLGDSLYTYRYVTITSQPVSLSVAAKSGALFRVEAVGQPPLAYQWLFNGAPIAGAISPLLSVTNIDSTKTGNYAVVVTSAVASATSDPALLTLSGAPTRLGNISTRGVAGTGANVLTAGFVITGTATKQMLIRVIGPSLGSLGITGFLPDPRLDLLNSTGVSVQTNDNWGTQTGGAQALAAIQQATARLGAFALANNSLDSVILTTLNPGSYTVQARGAGTTTGVALIEVYDASLTLNGPKAINVSTRGNVGIGENILIAGFVVNGTVARRMLIRGIGPTLRNFGLAANSVLPDPQLKLLDASGKTIASNDDWTTGEEGAIIAAAATAAGAFPLATASKDSSIIIMLAPGAYTAQLSGVGTTNNTGIALVEVYDIDP